MPQVNLYAMLINGIPIFYNSGGLIVYVYKKLILVLCLTMFTNVMCASSHLSPELNIENSQERLPKKVIISEMDSFLKGIEQAQGYLYLGAYKLHNHLLPNQRMMDSIRRVSKNPALRDKIFVTLESHLTLEEQKDGIHNIEKGHSHASYNDLGIQLISGSTRYKATHYKVLATNGYAIVGTTNFDKEFDEDGVITRDFSLGLTQPSLIENLQYVFETDKMGEEIQLQQYNIADLSKDESRFTWGPEQHRPHFKQLIEIATQSIEIYQQALQDEEITRLLVGAIERGVKVSILMSKFPFGVKHGNKSEESQNTIRNAKSSNHEALGEVRLTGTSIKEGELVGKKLHIHAKVVLIDANDPQKAIMYLGSANFYTPALDKDRNVGIITRDPGYIKPVQEQFIKDWQAHREPVNGRSVQ